MEGRRTGLATACLAAGLLSAGELRPPGQEAVEAVERPPNVLLITADDLGLQLGCYGDETVPTPRLDALAARGVRFETAYVTQASCSPSRSSILTGLFPHASGQYGLMAAGFRLHDALAGKTLPAYMKQRGYRTGRLGKFHVGPPASYPFDVKLGADGRDVRGMARLAKSFLAEQGPFFLMVNYTDPHVFNDKRLRDGLAYHSRRMGVPEEPVELSEVGALPFQRIASLEQRRRVRGYYSAIQRLDVGIGLLMEALEETGHAGDTLILFVSDHGPPFARAKTTCYEAGLRVPLFVCWPGISRPGTSDALVSTVDIVPTILDAVGVPMPDGLHGRSLRPLLDGSAVDPTSWREYVAGEFSYHGRVPYFPRRAIRDGRYKLIHNVLAGEAVPATAIDEDTAYAQSRAEGFPDADVARAFARFANPPEYELYDLAADPWEFHDLSGDPDHTAHLERLRSALADWQARTADPLLDSEDGRLPGT